MLRVFNETARYVDQGGGKRKGSFAIYLEPWHADVELFLDLRKNHGKEELRARDLFLALWIPDLFMKRVEANETWSLFSPDEVPDLQEMYGEQFENAYLLAEEKGLARQTLNARDLWQKIVDSQKLARVDPQNRSYTIQHHYLCHIDPIRSPQFSIFFAKRLRCRICLRIVRVPRARAAPQVPLLRHSKPSGFQKLRLKMWCAR